VVVSLLLILTGWILVVNGEFRAIEAREDDCYYYDERCDENTYIRATSLFAWGKIVLSLGIILLSAILIWVGLFFDRFHYRIRITMIIAAAILIVALMIYNMVSIFYFPEISRW